MIPKEQIVHDLAIVYINNKYGIDVTGNFDVSISEGNGSSSGSIASEHLPDVKAPKIIKVNTGEKGIFGRDKKQKIQQGYLVDDIFAEMIRDYHVANMRFLELLGE